MEANAPASQNTQGVGVPGSEAAATSSPTPISSAPNPSTPEADVAPVTPATTSTVQTTDTNPPMQSAAGQEGDSPSVLNKELANEGMDWFDKLTRNMSIDQSTSLIKFGKRGLPIVIFLLTAVVGVGVGESHPVTASLQGLYAQVSFLLGAIKMPLYSGSVECVEGVVCKARDFLTIHVDVFLLSFILVYFIWTFFDKKLAWRDRESM